jgi:hypothetical protein
MVSAQFISHHGKQILLMDFSGVHSAAEITQTVEEIKKIVAQQQTRSLLGLVDFTGMPISRESFKIIKGMAAHNRPYMRFIALVELGFVRSMAFKVMLQLSGRKNHRVFGKKEKALEWLGGL